MTAILSRCVVALLLLSSFPAAVDARYVQFPAPDREVMVPVAGGRIYVRINGSLTSGWPPVIFVHGGPGGTHGANLDAAALSNERAVIFYDQLDSGRSDHPGSPANWTVKRFVDELEAIRTALAIPRWYVVGHSWGGTVALEYAARRPEALAGVVLASPLISTRSWIRDADSLRKALPPETQRTLTKCERPNPPPPATCETATNTFYSAYLRREPRSAALKLYRNPADRGFNQQLYETMWGSSEFVSTGTLKRYDGEPLLARLDGKHTLFLVGQYDEARPATALGFSELVPGSELAVIPGSGHGILSDRPDETVAIIRGWLERQDVRSRDQN